MKKITGMAVVVMMLSITAVGQLIPPAGPPIVKDTNIVATATSVGQARYYVVGTNAYFEVVMQTGTNSFGWVEVKKSTWSE